jgi:hypothetical protein
MRQCGNAEVQGVGVKIRTGQGVTTKIQFKCLNTVLTIFRQLVVPMDDRAIALSRSALRLISGD